MEPTVMVRKKGGETPIYKVIFLNQGQVYEVYARNVAQGQLFGFIEVEQLLFGERSKIIVDSSEERLKTEFDGVTRFYVPLHSVVRIDEVNKEGASRITPQEGAAPKVVPMPLPPRSGGEHR